MDNRKQLLTCGFLALIAAGVGFAIRAGILGQWAGEYGFTLTELGTITGGGLVGFGLVILIVGSFIDAVGYKKLMVIAFILHLISGAMTLCADFAFASGGKSAVYWLLYSGMFLFAIANGICEAVINPLTATLYPNKKTHYLNILHAGWPAGLVIGGLLALLAGKVPWEILMGLFVVPVVLYGLIVLKEKFPQTEANQAGLGYGAMLKNCLVPLFFILVLLHVLVGYVELGTDSWINKITGSILQSGSKGTMLFIYASSMMFVLRFFAGPIVHRISSIGLLALSSILGALGLTLISNANGTVLMVLAVTIYSLGKTFLWPTMLGVVGEQFPRSSTVAMAILGAAGMLSAGLLGGPGIGYKQDYNASAKLQEISEETYSRYKAPKEDGFLFFPKVTGLDGSKVKIASDKGGELGNQIAVLEKDGKKLADEKELAALSTWWESNKATLDVDAPALTEAGIHGSRIAIRLTAIIPATMFVIFLLLLLYFKAKGGYKVVELDENGLEATPK